jgi:hypothetical protein
LTAGWGFEPHVTLLKEVRKEGVGDRRRPAKSAETRGESLGFKEEMEENILVIENRRTGYDTS